VTALPTGAAERSRGLPWVAVTAVTAVAVSVVLLTGCTPPGTAVTTPFATAPPALERGPVYEIKAADVSGVGTVLVDGQGITVYLFATDRRGSPSRCYDICAVQWPPLLLPSGVAAPLVGAGIEPRLLRTAPRSDGTTQITYNGWPLYLWPPDRSPGHATGQGLTNAGGRWYVVDPAGSAIVPP
jgi:predicted lipoprotein with Yx(FWY)xxD motif